MESNLGFYPVWVLTAFGLAAFAAAVMDYTHGKIYNVFNLAVLLAALVAAICFGGRAGFVNGIVGLAMISAIFIPLFFFGVFGGGDVKFLMALGVLLGPATAFELAGASIVVGGFGAIALLVKHKRVKIFFSEIFRFFRSLALKNFEIQWPALNREIKAPFGVAIFVGYAVVCIGGGTF